MRLLGFALLVIGFAVMNWKTMQARDITLGVVSEQLHRMPQQESYSVEDVRLAMKRVARDTWDRTTSWFYFSGVVMLTGGLLAAFGQRRQRHETSAA